MCEINAVLLKLFCKNFFLYLLVKVICLVLRFLCVCWMMYIVVVLMDIIVLKYFYVSIIYILINYSSLAYCDGPKRFVSYLCTVVALEL